MSFVAFALSSVIASVQGPLAPDAAVKWAEVLSKRGYFYGKGSGEVVLTLPLHDNNGDKVAAVRLVMKSFVGQTENNALARAMPGRQIVLFKAAHGGTSQLAWQPELDQARIDRLKLSHDQRVGHAYAQLIAAWKKAFPAGDIKPAALLWMQGESDARVPE